VLTRLCENLRADVDVDAVLTGQRFALSDDLPEIAAAGADSRDLADLEIGV
jgi:hypothetical protein